jgi:hypothetical protein
MAIYYLVIFRKLNIKKIIASLILTTIVFNLNYECMFADLKDEMDLSEEMIKYIYDNIEYVQLNTKAGITGNLGYGEDILANESNM